MVLITVEGLDGAGGTTLVNRISEEYPNVVTTSEPSDRKYGQLLRENLSDNNTNPLLDFYLFMVDRVDHIQNTIKPAEQNNKIVVSDRYADSTRSYQPVALTNDGLFNTQFEAKHFIEYTMKPWNYEPDLTLYIDISVDTAIKRSDGSEKYEKREFLRQVKDNYDALADSETYGHRIIRINGEQPIEDVTVSALGKIDTVTADRL